MGNRFASGKNAIAECDRCGFRFKLTELRKEVIKTKVYNLLVCSTCWDPDQPQLQLGMYPVDDPQGLRNPRPDLSYYQSGTTGLQIDLTNSNALDADGYPASGSRIYQWGWNPVGGARGFDSALTPNYLVLYAEVGTVTIQIGA
jgi:hypothetical protein